MHSKTDDKVSCSGSSRDFTPKSLKSYFLIFLDLQSLLTICNPLGPSGNKCRMQHILLLSCNSSFQLIERFAIKEDSPLHTTKASPGGLPCLPGKMLPEAHGNFGFLDFCAGLTPHLLHLAPRRSAFTLWPWLLCSHVQLQLIFRFLA